MRGASGALYPQSAIVGQNAFLGLRHGRLSGARDVDPGVLGCFGVVTYVRVRFGDVCQKKLHGTLIKTAAAAA